MKSQQNVLLYFYIYCIFLLLLVVNSDIKCVQKNDNTTALCIGQSLLHEAKYFGYKFERCADYFCRPNEMIQIRLNCTKRKNKTKAICQGNLEGIPDYFYLDSKDEKISDKMCRDFKENSCRLHKHKKDEYICKRTNGGECTLWNGSGKIEFDPPGPIYRVRNNSSIIIHCAVFNYPLSTIKWHNSKHDGYAEKALTRSLEYLKITVSDNFTCEAKNNQGKIIRRTIQIKVLPPIGIPILKFVRTRLNSIEISFLPSKNSGKNLKYFIDYHNESNKSERNQVNLSGRLYELTNLRSGTAYSLRIKSQDDMGESPVKEMTLLTTTTKIPSDRPQPIICESYPSFMNIIWSNPIKSLESYQVKYSDNYEKFGETTVEFTENLKSMEGMNITLKNLKPDTEYMVVLWVNPNNGSQSFRGSVHFFRTID